MINFFKKRKGFSLIEMMIATTIFSIVVILIVQVFQMVITSEKRVSNAFTIQEDLKFFTEFVFRDMRMARQYWGEEYVYQNFKYNANYDEIMGIEYIDAFDRLTTLGPVVDSDSGVTRVWVKKHIPNPEGGSSYLWFAITPANIDIQDLKFVIDEPMSGGVHAKQPMVTIFIKGKTLTDREDSELALQTSVTSRFYDE